MTPPAYRRDIDGLRAVAVIGVILYHAFPGRLSGGFVGVDVFFVISGYLISGIILSQLDAGEFTFRGFYARRIRRIIPAMVLVVAASLVAGWFLLWPDEYFRLGRHAAGAIASVLNIVLWKQGVAYFDLAIFRQPLIHLWSLGVEEQFYLVWPPLLVLAWRRGRALRLLVVGGLTASFILNVAITAHDAHSAFYLPFTRFWEMLLGAWLVMRERGEIRAPDERRARVAEWLAIVGMLAIVCGFAVLDRLSAYPGWWSLTPTLGTVLVIAAGERTWINRRLLGHQALVRLGLLSYAIYLWHWPLLAFARILVGATPSIPVRIGLLVAAVLAAEVSYRLVERPIRRRGKGWAPIAAVLAAAAVTGAAGLAVRGAAGFPDRPAFRFGADLDPRDGPFTVPACPDGYAVLIEQCGLSNPGAAPTIALIGDSHARRLFLGLSDSLRARGENLLVMSCSLCVPFYDALWTAAPDEDHSGGSRFSSSLDAIVADRSIRTVIISSRGPVYIALSGASRSWFADHPRLVSVSAPSRRDADGIFADGLHRTLEALLSAGKRVVFVVALPELPFDPRDCFRPWSSRPGDACELRTDEYARESESYRAATASALRAFPSVIVFDPSTIICPSGRCELEQEGHLVYRDDNHLSLHGSLFLGRAMLRVIPVRSVP